ncbi:hypothetical protein [Nonomuraea rubra]|uniref:hypothetical protein n=1 Tax=Nonomuraea rubra TaxID=46180 RepID=UPI0033E376C8
MTGSARETATATVSTFAASTWPRDVREEEERTTAVRRSSTSMTVSEPAAVAGRTATQSPVHDVSRSPAAGGSTTRTNPFSAATSHRPRSARTTRPGTSPSARDGAKERSRSASQP